MWDYALIIAAGFGAGVINSIAGGGTFLTFPALVWIGIPPIAANATSTLAVLPGYLSAALGYREDLARIDTKDLRKAVVVSLGGGLAGGLALLVSNEAFFALVIPLLLFAATLVFTFQSRLLDGIRASGRSIASFGVIGLAAVSVYGGYFNGGLGIIMLALFSLWGMTDLGAMNGLKNILSVVISAISALAFAIAGLIHWPEMVAMAVAAIIGGYSGARVARIVPVRALRMAITAIGFTLAAIFFARAWA